MPNCYECHEPLVRSELPVGTVTAPGYMGGDTEDVFLYKCKNGHEEELIDMEESYRRAKKLFPDLGLSPYERGRKHERARWQPLWEIINQWLDVTSNLSDNERIANIPRIIRDLHQAVEDLKQEGEEVQK